MEADTQTPEDQSWTLSGTDQSEAVDALLYRSQRKEYRVSTMDSEGNPQYPVVFDQGSFWRWGGQVWEEIDRNRMRRDCLRINTWAGRKDGKPFSVNKAWVKGVLEAAEWMADESGFFEAANHGYGMAFKNGWVSASRDGLSFRANEPGDRCRHLHGVEFSPDAKCPNWERFLHNVFRTDRDREEKIRFLSQFLGACLTGQAHVYDRAVMLLGQGANGKSVLCDVVEGLFPVGSVSGVPPHDMSKLERASPLARSLLNMVTDIPTKDLRDAGGFKQIVSGDPIEGRKLYENSFRFRPHCGHLFSANALPATNDFSHGFFRRWVVLQFNQTFEGSKTVPRSELVASILQEKAGIMAWALRGAVDLMSSGSYFIPRSNAQAAAEWRHMSDQVVAFIDACVEEVFRPGDARDENGVPLQGTSGQELYRRYRLWSEENGLGRLSNVKFAQRLKGLKIHKRRIRKGVEWGVRMRPERDAWGATKLEMAEMEEEDD